MLTIIKCLDCGETMAYACTSTPWKCAKCGKQHPKVLPAPSKGCKKPYKVADEKPFK